MILYQSLLLIPIGYSKLVGFTAEALRLSDFPVERSNYIASYSRI